MKYNFDEIIDRSGTDAVKWDGMKDVWGRTDLIPLWVADMDFATAPFIMDAVRKRCENPILGYTCKPDSYYQAIVSWVKNRYGFLIEKEMINYFVSTIMSQKTSLHFSAEGMGCLSDGAERKLVDDACGLLTRYANYRFEKDKTRSFY